jgi:hypothetical protein
MTRKFNQPWRYLRVDDLEARRPQSLQQLPDREPLVRTWPGSLLYIDISAAPASKVLAVIPSSPSARAWQAIRSLATHFQCFDEPMQIVVIGPTMDDQTLMALPNVFVTGRVEVEELRN